MKNNKILSALLTFIILLEIPCLATGISEIHKAGITVTNNLLADNDFLFIEEFFPKELDTWDNITGVVAVKRMDKLEYIHPSELIVELLTVDNHTLDRKTLDDLTPIIDGNHFLVTFKAIFIPSPYYIKITAVWNPPWGGEITATKSITIFVGYWRKIDELVRSTQLTLYNISFTNFLRELVEGTKDLGLDGLYYLMIRQYAVKAKAEAVEANLTLLPSLNICVIRIPGIPGDTDPTVVERQVNQSLTVLDAKGISYTVTYIRTIDEWLNMLNMSSMEPKNLIVINCHGSILPSPSQYLEDITVLSTMYDISKFMNTSVYDVLEDYGDNRSTTYPLWLEDFDILDPDVWEKNGIPESESTKVSFENTSLTLNPEWLSVSSGVLLKDFEPYVSSGMLELTGVTFSVLGFPGDTYEMFVKTTRPISITNYPIAYFLASATPVSFVQKSYYYLGIEIFRHIYIVADIEPPYHLYKKVDGLHVEPVDGYNLTEYFAIDFYTDTQTLTYVYWIKDSASPGLSNTTNHKYLIKEIEPMGPIEIRPFEMRLYEDWVSVFGSLPSSLYVKIRAHNLVLHVDRFVLGDALVHWLTYEPTIYDILDWWDIRRKEREAYELIMSDSSLREDFLNFLISKGYISEKDVQISIYRQYIENITSCIGGKHWIWVVTSTPENQTFSFYVIDSLTGVTRYAMPFDWVANSTLMREVQGFSYLKERNYWELAYTTTSKPVMATKTSEAKTYIENATTGLGTVLPNSLSFTGTVEIPMLVDNPDIIPYYETATGYVVVGAYLGGNGIYVFNLLENATITCLAAYATWFSQWGVKAAEIVTDLELMASIIYSYNSTRYKEVKTLATEFDWAWSERNFTALSLLFNDTMKLCDEILEEFDNPLETILDFNIDIYSSLSPFIRQVLTRMEASIAGGFQTVIDKINEMASKIASIDVARIFDAIIGIQKLIMVAAPLTALLAWGAGFGSMTLIILSALVSLGAYAGIQVANWVKQTFQLVLNTLVGVLNFISRMMIIMMRQMIQLINQVCFYIQQGLYILSETIKTAVSKLVSVIADLAVLVVQMLTESIRTVYVAVNTAIQYFALRFDQLEDRIDSLVGNLQLLVYNLSRAIYTFPEIKDTIYKMINEAWKRYGWLRYSLETLGRTVENFLYSIKSAEPLELLRQAKTGIFGGMLSKIVTGTTIFFMFQKNGTLVDVSSVNVTISSVGGVVETGMATRVAKGIYAYTSIFTLKPGIYSVTANGTLNGDWITATSEFYVESVEQPKQGDLYFTDISVSCPRKVSAGSTFRIQINATQVMWRWGMVTLRIALYTEKGELVKAKEISHISVGPEMTISRYEDFSIPLFTWPGEYVLVVTLIEELTGDETSQRKPITVTWGVTSYIGFTLRYILVYIGAGYGIISLIRDMLKKREERKFPLPLKVQKPSCNGGYTCNFLFP